MERFLTVEQVAQAFQVNLDTVRHWLRTGRLRGVKVGRAWRVPERELHNLSAGAANTGEASTNSTSTGSTNSASTSADEHEVTQLS